MPFFAPAGNIQAGFPALAFGLHVVVPFVLAGLGAHILLESGSFSLFA